MDSPDEEDEETTVSSSPTSSAESKSEDDGDDAGSDGEDDAGAEDDGSDSSEWSVQEIIVKDSHTYTSSYISCDTNNNFIVLFNQKNNNECFPSWHNNLWIRSIRK